MIWHSDFFYSILENDDCFFFFEAKLKRIGFFPFNFFFPILPNEC